MVTPTKPLMANDVKIKINGQVIKPWFFGTIQAAMRDFIVFGRPHLRKPYPEPNLNLDGVPMEKGEK